MLENADALRSYVQARHAVVDLLGETERTFERLGIDQRRRLKPHHMIPALPIFWCRRCGVDGAPNRFLVKASRNGTRHDQP